MKPSQIRLETHRQCYRGTHELGRWTSRIKAIVAAKARTGGKIIAEIVPQYTQLEYMMHMFL